MQRFCVLYIPNPHCRIDLGDETAERLAGTYLNKSVNALADHILDDGLPTNRMTDLLTQQHPIITRIELCGVIGIERNPGRCNFHVGEHLLELPGGGFHERRVETARRRPAERRAHLQP